MKSKKILLINPIPLFPKIMASQDRAINMAIKLSKEHSVTVLTSIKNKEQEENSLTFFNKYNIEFLGVKAINRNCIGKLYLFLIFLFAHYILGWTNDYFYSSKTISTRKITKLLRKRKYDVIQLQYWFNWRILKARKNQPIVKVIDTQDILYEKREQQYRNENNGKLTFFKQRLVKNYKKLETSAYNYADLLIGITPYDQSVLSKINTNCKTLIIPTGQDIDYFSNYSAVKLQNTVLFYGSMGGKENIDAFFRFYNHIYPLVKKEIKDVKVIVLGANPPESIKNLHNSDNMIITGFIEDVREYIALADVMVVPLNVAAGFRSRTVEVMAMGVPVVGTHKALDNVGLENGIQGYISDSDKEMAKYIIALLYDKTKLKEMSYACRLFAEKKYSIENTYGKLSHYYKEL